MANTWVSLDIIPSLGRPPEVERVFVEAAELRDRLRQANEELARLEAETEQAETADVQAAAEKIRSGSAPGAVSSAVGKARHAAELATRNRDALTLASDAAQLDPAASMREHADDWLRSLDQEVEQARQRGLDAIAQLEQAAHEIGAAAGAAAWVRSGLADSRWDRRTAAMQIGSVAPNSTRVTANSEPLGVAELVAFCHELLAPPAPAHRTTFGAPAAVDAA